jgi:hypothetical protein
MFQSESVKAHQRRLKAEGYGPPCMTLPEFAKSKGITRSWIQRKERNTPLPKPRFESRKCRNTVRFYAITDLEKWYEEVNAK